MTWLLILLATCAVIAAYSVGYTWGKQDRMKRPERDELDTLRGERHRLYRMAAQHASTEPFAVIVMDELDKNRGIK